MFSGFSGGAGSAFSIAKDYVQACPAKYITIVGGNIAVSMGKAMIDGKRGKAVLTEGLVGRRREPLSLRLTGSATI